MIISDHSKIKKFLHTEWRYIHHRSRTPFYQFLLFEGTSKHYNNEIRFPYEVDLLYVDKELFGNERAWKKLQKKIRIALNKNKAFLLSIIKDSYALNRAIEKKSKQLEKLDYKNMAVRHLLESFTRYVNLTLRYGYCILIPLFAEEELEKRLKLLIQKKFKTDREKIFQILSAPSKPSVVCQEEISLLRLAEMSKKGMDISREIKKHLEKFSWLKNNSFDANFSTAYEIEERIEKLKKGNPREKLKTLNQKAKIARAEFQKYRKFFSHDQKALSLIETVRETIYFRSWRTERYYRNAYYLQPLLKKISNLLGLINIKDIFYLTPFEIKDLLVERKRADIKEIKKRAKGYLLYSNNEGNIILSGQAMREIKKKFVIGRSILKYSNHGQIAYVGKALGPARIIFNKEELKKLKDGEILITSSTTPDYVPFLKRAKAIITEEGGILCHAAVISRELHIPCIIGVKAATKNFQNGDLVEISLEGKITILKKTHKINL